MARIESPCIGICSTTLGDDVCRGCKRHSDEILSWGHAEADMRESVMQRIESLTIAAVTEYFELLDKNQLQQQLTQRRIRYTKRFAPQCWVVDLLRVGAGRIQDIEAYGITLTDQARRLSPDTGRHNTSSRLLEIIYQKINQTILEETDRLICEKS
ncbi:MAG: DUF1289 domain-containing protein [Oceanospirillum sp.]|nr:DUF1289 domain-containing protein [Oceanospirillum sp.]MDX1398266.1 DUF1289 domain-containing protein [Oceanospirillum sp.]